MDDIQESSIDEFLSRTWFFHITREYMEDLQKSRNGDLEKLASKIVCLKLNGEVLEPDLYMLHEDGSVSLMEEIVYILAPGEHKFEIIYENGSSFEVELIEMEG